MLGRIVEQIDQEETAMNGKETATIGLVQMNSRIGDKAANLAKAEKLLAELAGRAQIACLPELFNVGYHLNALSNTIFDLAETIPGETTAQLSKLAHQFKLGIIAGIVEHDPDVTGMLYDTAVILNRSGELIARYRKSHLYPDENRFFCSGGELPIFEVDGLKIGVAICFEHAFPHIFTTLALRGAQVVFNPSAVPVGFSYLQDLRTRARAQDNQMFVAAVNHVGPEADVTYCGRSMVANPRGEVLALAPDDAEAAIAVELPLDLIFDQRRQELIFRASPDLYLPGTVQNRRLRGWGRDRERSMERPTMLPLPQLALEVGHLAEGVLGFVLAHLPAFQHEAVRLAVVDLEFEVGPGLLERGRILVDVGYRAGRVRRAVNDQHGRGQLIDQLHCRRRAASREAVPGDPGIQGLDLRQEQHRVTAPGAEARQAEPFRVNVVALAQERHAVFDKLLHRVVGRTLLEGLPAHRQHDEALRRKPVGDGAVAVLKPPIE
jgi:predicted amidohydrolase